MRIEYFQLIDRIVAIDTVGRTIQTEATAPKASTVFEGHFPGYPILPGVLLIEAMAQTGGWLVIALTNFERMPFLAAVKEAKLRSFVLPGQHLSLSAELAHQGSGFAVVQAAASSAGKPVCEAQITYRVQAFPTPEFRQHMDAMARRLAYPQRATTHG